MAGLVALSLGGSAAKVLSLLALVGVGAALAASGHARAGYPRWLTRPAVFLHAVGIAFWVGALVPLGAALASPGAPGVAALRRFSQIAPFAVLPLIAAGIALAVVQLRSIDALWTTAYGNVFLIKMALLVPLFTLAVLNRYRLTQPAVSGVCGSDRNPAPIHLLRTAPIPCDPRCCGELALHAAAARAGRSRR